MIPATFEYARPASVDEAVSALQSYGEDAKVLAGGQSLLPLLRLRMAAPSALVDLGRVGELRGIRDDGDALAIGAMTPHSEVVASPLVREHCALLAVAAQTIGDPAVRHRGTIGGSLAHADAAADMPAVALVLDASLVAAGPGGRRTIRAGEFFVDYLETALGPGDVLVEIRVPKLGAGWGYHYEKFNRVVQAWALVGVAAAVRREDGRVAEARIGLTNMGATPVRAGGAESALAGADATIEAVTSAAEHAADGLSPPSDIHAQADYRAHLARVLTRRAVAAAAGL